MSVWLAVRIRVMTVNAEAAYIGALSQRIKAARLAVNLTQKQVATALGVSLDAYKKYENRENTVLPPHLMEPFAILVRRSVTYIVTGHETPGTPAARISSPRAKKVVSPADQ